ncbi:hypothetical protein Gogos_009578, partial [Gossypium gossypioides]|nr:hypothetical protein [Gossypium gossypioides]
IISLTFTKNRNLFIFQRKSWSSSEIIKASRCWTKKSSLAPKDGLIDNIGLPHEEPFSRIEPFLTPMDGTGDWVIGYNRFLGNCSTFDAELWGILDGLKLIQCRGHSSVVIHFDSLEVKVNGFKIYPREENQCADYLVKLAFERKEDLQLVETL